MVPPPLAADDPRLRTCHLLALPAEVQADELEVLALSRFPRASWAPGDDEPAPRTGILPVVTSALGLRTVPERAAAPRAMRLGRQSSLVGPYALAPRDAAALGLPTAAQAGWLLRVPRERGAPPWSTGDRDGLGRAFPEGLPVRAEERVVSWAVAAARRLGGWLRIAEHGTVLAPDPGAAVDLTVLASHWLEPAQVLDVVRRVLPRAVLSDQLAGRVERRPADLDPQVAAVLARHGVRDEAERARLRAESAAFDAAAAGVPSHGFGLLCDLGRDGLLGVDVAEALEVPPALAASPWAQHGVVEFRVHWEPLDLEQREAERPDEDHRRARARTAPLVDAVAWRLHEVLGGEVADEAGFLVDPQDLRPGR